MSVEQYDADVLVSPEAPPRPSHAADIAVLTGRPGPASARTLLDILDNTVAVCPDGPAIDDGSTVLTYRQLDLRVRRLAGRLREAGVGLGDRVGVRVPSGHVDLYVAILGALAAGAAYVPVDADDPDERAELVWTQAQVSAVLGERLSLTVRRPGTGRGGVPTPADDAWIIFTSGSTGAPKGVAVTHRAAAAFVDAEARLFLQANPLGPGDRVLAGLSVAFDASCEEMWLAWRHGACLVPAPRALVKSGADLGPWLARQRVTVVSTVPTLASLWPVESLARVRLLIFGGEACPPEVADRFAAPRREVWNTYGPTEATVVACAAPLVPGEPVRIGRPLAGWQLAVVDPTGRPVRWGQTGELVIGGVGLGRYLDRAKDAEKFRPLPALSWPRAYYSGDLVRAEPDGLVFVGRADDQVKIGGRRIELGEIDAALLALPGVTAAASAVKRTGGGLDVLVGYLVTNAPVNLGQAQLLLAERLPASLVPRLAVLPDLPTRTSGKVDRKALPWPLPGAGTRPRPAGDPVLAWLAEQWTDLLGTEVSGDANFFTLGGTSLAAARLVSVLRTRYPAVSVADLYQHPTLAGLRARLAAPARPQPVVPQRAVRPVSPAVGWAQTVIGLVLYAVSGLRWVLSLAMAGNLASLVLHATWLPRMSWWPLIAGWLLLFSPAGRALLVGTGVRALCGRLRPGSHARGGGTHLRLWTAERLVAMFGMANLVGTPMAARYARLLGCRVGRDVVLHALPPVTGLLTLGDGSAVEPEADLSGWWLDGDQIHIGLLRVDERARIGGRSTLLPGTVVGAGAEILPGATVSGTVPAGQRWSGSPARLDRDAPENWWPSTPPERHRGWRFAYQITPLLRALLPVLAALPGLYLGLRLLTDPTTLTIATDRLLLWTPVLTVLGILVYALLVAGVVRLAGRALRAGVHPVYSRAGWAGWLTHELSDQARRTLFPLYASLFTPMWLRLLGAKVGRRVEASTVLSLPRLTSVADGAFLADDTLVAPYELHGQWLRLGRAKVGERAFVGNSGMVGPGRSVGDEGLIGVLSDTPVSVPAGSSWLGRPPMRLPRTAERHDPARTFAPPRRLVLARALVELCRLVPLLVLGGLGVTTSMAFVLAYDDGGTLLEIGLGGPILLAGGLVAAGITTLAKWLLVGRIRVGHHPLWSSFVWRNELYDTFVEELAVPSFVQSWLGTPLLNWWLRTLGAKIGRGVWCETYWLPEPDLVRLGAGASVNRGGVLQTHLFHDRVMRLNGVELGAGATLGPHSIVLPDSAVGANATIAPGSLVMGGETVPADSRWQGNPIIAADH